MYSYNDIKNIYRLGRCGELINDKTYPELYNIRKKLQSIIHRTAFFTSHIDDKTSYQTLNYVIDLLLSLDDKELEEADFHLIDTFTYPYVMSSRDLINGINTVFRPNRVEDIYTYVFHFTKIFGRLHSLKASDINICKYKKLDLLSDIFYEKLLEYKDYYALMELTIAYFYRNIDKYDKDTIINTINCLLSDNDQLLKMRLNSNFPYEGIMEDIFMRGIEKDIVVNAYNMVQDTIEKIVNNEEFPREKIIIR